MDIACDGGLPAQFFQVDFQGDCLPATERFSAHFPHVWQIGSKFRRRDQSYGELGGVWRASTHWPPSQ
jgi:hypothetical protein